MKSAGIIVNTGRDIGFRYTAEIIKWLRENNCLPVIESGISGFLPEKAMDLEQMCRHCDFIIVLGGDGTILHAAGSSALYNKPVIGFNLGTLGYLTDVDKSESLSALAKFFSGEFKIEKRMMLEAEVLGGTSPGPIIALNDICVLRGGLSKMINLEIMVNDQYIDTYKADGIIISTPTGSTAYNLSAGGPILKPDTELIAITPVCPHKIHSRPSVISGQDEVYIKIRESHGKDINLSVDGQERLSLNFGDRIRVFRSKYYTSLIKTNSLGFFDILREKLYR